MSRGRKYDMPASGESARSMNTVLNRDCADPTRMSHASASDIPAPAATPFTAAMVGLSMWYTAIACAPDPAVLVLHRVPVRLFVLPRAAPTCAPEQKPRPAPVNTTARTPSSFFSRSQTSRISWRSVASSEFSDSGRVERHRRHVPVLLQDQRLVVHVPCPPALPTVNSRGTCLSTR
ncbi:MAG: hypothetical protein U5Q44_11970 [Dehalococcoidia bacterium]|nr:hypothetical protein [Dehalococcoidia bacterium]